MATAPENWETIKALFEEALDVGSAERPAFLLKTCSDPVVRAEVERLLSEYSQDSGFLSIPVLADVAFGTGPRRFRTGELLANRFKIICFIAAGGMGEVYEAEDIELREHVALKTILPDKLREADAVSRFRREVQLARKVTHPNVCRIFDLFRHKPDGEHAQETLFVTMELLHGKTLAERLKERGAIEIQEALPILRQLASALAAAHELGIVHRDLKPGNIIMVNSGRAKGVVRAVITDFGLALQSFDSNAATLSTQTTMLTERGLLGTPTYMAPEQLQGQRATIASDVYALGLVIYEILTGVRPFTERNAPFLINAILNRQPQAPSVLNHKISSELDALIQKALEKDPANRYQSARDLLADLAKVGSEPASAVKGPTRAQFGQAAERRYLALSHWLVLGTLAILLAGMVVISNYYKFAVPRWPTEHKSEPSQSTLSYYIITQNYREGRPSGEPYRVSEHHVFEANSGIHLIFSSQQLGYLYILNEGPSSTDEQPVINTLFPSPSANAGSAQIIPARELTIPEGGPLIFDTHRGAEKLWLVWSKESLAELEALKVWVNFKDHGRIGNKLQAQHLQSFLAKSLSFSIESSQDDKNQATTLRGSGDILVHLVRLDHE
jgi:serine/threonine protein kinase